MKICHITSMHDWQDDRIFQRACVGLARKGHEVYLIAIGEENTTSDFKSLGVNVILLPKLTGLKRRLKGSRITIKKAVEINADVYQFHDPDILPHVRILKKTIPKAAIVYDIHENYAGRFSNWGLPSFLGSWFRVYEENVINKLDGITVVSKSMEALFEKVKTPIEITRNSTDIERLKGLDLGKKEENSDKLIITSGSHSHERNCLQTVKAIKYLNGKEDRKPIFKFVGRYIGEIEQEMKQQAIIDKTSDQLILDGMMPWEDNFKRISKAYCGCVFYKDNVNNRVGIPNRIFEYMYCGLPVIVSDFPELKKVVESSNCGIVVNSESPEDIAKGISTLLDDSEKAKQMGLNGQKALKDVYGYHIDLDKLEIFYNKISK